MAASAPSGGARHNAEFIEGFTEREARKQDALRKVQLKAEQRAARREKLRHICFLTPADADCTQVNIAGMLRKWKRRSAKQTERPHFDSLDHLCETYKVTSRGTSWDYFSPVTPIPFYDCARDDDVCSALAATHRCRNFDGIKDCAQARQLKEWRWNGTGTQQHAG